LGSVDDAFYGLPLAVPEEEGVVEDDCGLQVDAAVKENDLATEVCEKERVAG
jgi:hypothetical protein